MSQFPMPSPRREGEIERRQRGVNINQTWGFLNDLMPHFNAMLNRADRMGQIVERSASMRPSMELLSFQRQQKEAEQGDKMLREAERDRRYQRGSQREADFAARQDRQRAESQMYGIKTDARGDVISRFNTGYGGESPHQSEAQLAGWGVEGAGVASPTASQMSRLGFPSPVAPGVGAPGLGGGTVGDINVSANASPSVSPAAGYNAMVGGGVLGGGAQYNPFPTSFNTDFESSELDKEKKKREE